MASDGNSDGWETPKTKSKGKLKPKRIPVGISAASTSGGSTSSNTGTTSNVPPVKLCCNHFIVQHKQPLPTIYQYKVTIQSRNRNTSDLKAVESKGLKRKIFNALRENKAPELDRSAYDGDSQLYSTRSLAAIENVTNEVPFPRTEINPVWVPLPRDNIGASSSQPEEEIPDLQMYVVFIEFVKLFGSPDDPREVKSFPSEHTAHGEPGPDDKIVLQALSTSLHDCSQSTMPDGVCVRSNYYPKPNLEDNEGKNVAFAKGFYSSFRLLYGPPDDNLPRLPRLLLNFSDVRTAVLVSKPIQTFIQDLVGIDVSQDELKFTTSQLKEVNKALAGVRVQTNLGPKYLRRYTIEELDCHQTSESARFKYVKINGQKKQHKTCTVRQHFHWNHDYKLQKPNWPLLRMRGKKNIPGNNDPVKNDPVYIPIEVCTIVDGQRYQRLSPEQQRAILELGKVTPHKRKDIIESSLNTIAATYEAHNGLLGNGHSAESFGIQIGRKMIDVEGQILRAPTVHYYNQSVQLCNRRDDGTISNVGRWNVDRQQMASPVSLHKQEWAVYVFYNGARPEGIEPVQGKFLAENLRKMFTRMGMLGDNDEPLYESEPVNVYRDSTSPDQRINFMLGKVRLPKKLIVAVLPSKSRDLYVPLKRICETTPDGGRMVITQCVVMGRQTSLSAQHLANLALKINLKMGGNNSNVDPPNMANFLGERLEKPTRTCIFGIDVSHGSSGDSKRSIAAVVASVEGRLWSRYAPQVRTQEPKQEAVENLKEMVVELLIEFKKNLGYFPGQIIVYRDGISESQFSNVGDVELARFKEACKIAEETNRARIRITFIIVQKRHHTRFFAPKITKEGTESFENMEAGTVVTSQVCQTRNEDFYLCSHKSLERHDQALRTNIQLVTSRPAHYTVLCDELNLGQSNIQNLTNYLCYCFGRATTAVSIPAPVYYAHVAAKHYSCFLEDDAVMWGNINYKLTQAPYRMFYI